MLSVHLALNCWFANSEKMFDLLNKGSDTRMRERELLFASLIADNH